MILVPGASHTLNLDPAHLFIDTGVQVLAGETYQLQAEGMWKDARLIVDANGWTRFGIGWLRRFNRMPNVNWFTLIACIGRNLNTARAIGKSQVITITTQDQPDAAPQALTVFANDWPSRYDNNFIASPEEGGPMRLTITRLS